MDTKGAATRFVINMMKDVCLFATLPHPDKDIRRQHIHISPGLISKALFLGLGQKNSKHAKKHTIFKRGPEAAP
jgi:hypothetical protein